MSWAWKLGWAGLWPRFLREFIEWSVTHGVDASLPTHHLFKRKQTLYFVHFWEAWNFNLENVLLELLGQDKKEVYCKLSCHPVQRTDLSYACVSSRSDLAASQAGMLETGGWQGGRKDCELAWYLQCYFSVFQAFFIVMHHQKCILYICACVCFTQYIRYIYMILYYLNKICVQKYDSIVLTTWDVFYYFLFGSGPWVNQYIDFTTHFWVSKYIVWKAPV